MSGMSEPAHRTLTIRIPTTIYDRIKEDAAVHDRSANYIAGNIFAAHYATIDALADADAPSL